MLVLSRQEREEIVIGDYRTVMAQLSPEEERVLRGCSEPVLAALAARLIETLGKPIRHRTYEIRRSSVRHGITAPKDIPVHREEVFDALTGRDPNAPCAIGLPAGLRGKGTD